MENKPLPKINPDGEGMSILAGILQEVLPTNVGFVLITFPLNENQTKTNAISNAHRQDVIRCLRISADQIESTLPKLNSN